MFSTIQTDLVCGRAQYGPVYRRDGTGLDHEMAVLHCSNPKIIFYCTSYSEVEILNYIKNLTHLTIIPSCISITGSSSLRAPTSLVCPPSASPAPMLSRRPSLGTDARLRAPALAVGMELFLLSLSYISP
jgi:hypothetical protein